MMIKLISCWMSALTAKVSVMVTENPGTVIGCDVLADHTNLVRNQIRRIEPNAELSNHGDVAASTHGLHESLGTRFGNRPKMVHELVLCHPNARILDLDGQIVFVRNDLDEEIRLGLDLCVLLDARVSNFLGKRAFSSRCWCGSAPASLHKDWHTYLP